MKSPSFSTTGVIIPGLLLSCCIVSAGPVRLIKDINPDARQSAVISYNIQGGADYDPEFRLVNGIGYFTADDGIHGAELWRTDGTAAGTFLTADLYPGELGGVGRVSSGFADVNGRLVFDAQSWLAGSELHISSGTPATTIPLRELDFSDPFTSVPVSHPFLAGNGRVLYFAAPAFGVAMGRELWRTDGSKEGTRLVKDIAPGPNSGVANASSIGVSRAGMLGDVLFFSGYDETAGSELWRSDGTAAGTVRVKDIATGMDFFHDSNPSEFHGAGNLMYFAASTEAGRELWRTNGTPSGTFMLTDITTGINPGTGNNFYSSIGILAGAAVPQAPAGDPQFIYKASRFVKRTASDGSEVDVFVDRLMLTHGDARPSVNLAPEIDGIGAGPVAAGNFVWVLASGEVPGPDGPVSVNGLWRVTSSGATFLAKSAGFELTGTPTRVYALNELGGLMSFNALTGQEIAGATVVYPTDGDPPYALSPVRQPVEGATPRHFFAYGERLFFTFDNGVVGEEPWISDGTGAGTFLLKDINQTTAQGLIVAGAAPLFLNAGGRAIFRSTTRLPDTTSLYEKMFITDGTTAGTQEVAAARPSFSREPWGVELGGRVLFPDEFSIAALEAPAFQTPVPLQQDPQYSMGGFAKSGNQAFFLSNDLELYQSDGVYEQSLWRTDGTPAGTRRLTGFMDPHRITTGPQALNDKALFFTQQPGETERLWVSDGTAAGTRELLEMESRREVTVWGDAIWFRRSDGIWKTDGTAAGTRLAVPFVQGNSVLTISTRLVVFKNALWFGGSREVNGVPGTIEDGGLFRSDGTAAGTTLVVTRALPEGTAPVVAGNFLYWMADRPYNSNQYSPGDYLHRTDGTIGSTQIVKTLPFERGAYGFIAKSLCAVDDTVFFCFGDVAHGVELWRSNGTAAGTTMVQDISPGARDSFINAPTSLDAPEPAGRSMISKIGTGLYFWADSPEGTEPRVMDAASVNIAAPVIGTLPARLLVYQQETMSYTVPLVSGGPVTWATPLPPPGMTINATTGVLSGYPMWAGNYSVTVDAGNNGATASAVLNVRVVDRDALFPRISTETPGVLHLTTGSERNALYNIQVSTDLQNWTTPASGLGPGETIVVPRPGVHLYVRSVVQFQ